MDEEADLIALIKKRHMCEEHSKPCYVQSNGMHYQYTIEDLSIWASLLVSLLAIPAYLHSNYQTGPPTCYN
jgi:hypothetical protein